MRGGCGSGFGLWLRLVMARGCESRMGGFLQPCEGPRALELCFSTLGDF
jgi:hypothetical protein